MSWSALTWAKSIKVGSSSEKQVLMALAYRHNEDLDLCYPSISSIVEFTELDRKTVISCLSRLAAKGLIADTGERMGKTKQIVVYKLLGMEGRPAGFGETHYVYRLTAPNGEFYIGVRSCFGDTTSDRYMGSGKWPQSMQFNKVDMQKEIIGVYATRVEAELVEQKMIDEALKNPLCKNSPKTGTVRNSPDFSGETVPKLGHGKTIGKKSPSGAKAPSVERAKTTFEAAHPDDKAVHAFRLLCVQWAMKTLKWSAADAGVEFDRFVDSNIANGRRYANWERAWHNWCRSDFCGTAKKYESNTDYRKGPIRG